MRVDAPRLPEPEKLPTLERALAGDAAAREAVILDLVPLALGRARPYRSRPDGEDLAAEALVALTSVVDRARPGVYPAAYVSATVRGHLRSVVTTAARRALPTMHLAAGDATPLDDLAVAGEPEERPEPELLEALAEEIDRLPPELAEVVRLRFGLDPRGPITSDQRVGWVVGVSRVIVTKRRERALELLRLRLSNRFAYLRGA